MIYSRQYANRAALRGHSKVTTLLLICALNATPYFVLIVLKMCCAPSAVKRFVMITVLNAPSVTKDPARTRAAYTTSKYASPVK